jgi:hypothetical protein
MAISDLVGHELSWTQPRFLASGFELTRAGDVIGRLTFRSAWGSLATAEIDDGCWSFKRLGFLKTRVSVRACDAEEELGVFRNNTWKGGGTLELARGPMIQANTNMWHSKYEFVGAGDEVLLTYHTHRSFKLSGEMQILPPARNLPELPWLVMLGWYLAVMMYRDDSAAVVAT